MNYIECTNLSSEFSKSSHSDLAWLYFHDSGIEKCCVWHLEFFGITCHWGNPFGNHSLVPSKTAQGPSNWFNPVEAVRPYVRQSGAWTHK